MSFVVIGLNHRTSPVEVLEKVMVPEDAMIKVLHGLSVRDDIREAVVLSTCNRTEVYAVVERFHAAFADIRRQHERLAVGRRHPDAVQPAR